VNCEPVPMGFDQIALYVAYLVDVKRLKYATVRQYLCAVTNMHKANNLQDPVKADWRLSHLLKGVRRELGDAQAGATPITPRHLLALHTRIDTSCLFGASVWTASLLGFFGMLRPGNFLCGSQFDPLKHITVLDVTPVDKGYCVSLKWSKTVQFRERVLEVFLPDLGSHPLNPAFAMRDLLQFHRDSVKKMQPLLCDNQGQPLSYDVFMQVVRYILVSCGMTEEVSGHSFRRGGASWAFEIGLPGELIQEIGFWKSAAYLRYLEMSSGRKLQALQLFGSSLPSQ